MSTPINKPISRLLHDRAKTCMPGGNTRLTVFEKPHPTYAERGLGCYVWDVDGHRYIDCINNFTALIHGHAHPEIVAAACDQVSLGSAFGLPTKWEISLAELLCDRIDSVEECRFMNSGSEAVMMGIKAARAYTGRRKIAKCEGAYHGSYDYVEVSLDTGPQHWGDGAPKSVAYCAGTPAGVVDDVVVLPFSDIDASMRILRDHADDLACVIVDPMPNRAGLIPASAGYLEALRDVTREIGALLIFDEVISFRLGYRGAQRIWGVEADLTILGKIIGGGFPVGAVGGRRTFMEVFDPSFGKPRVPHTGTFTANPVTMRAGLTAMRLLDEACLARLNSIGDYVREGISETLARLNKGGCVTGYGSLLRLHFTDRKIRDYRSTYLLPQEAARASQFMSELLQRGVLIAPNGLMALSTPMSVDRADEILNAFRESLARVLK